MFIVDYVAVIIASGQAAIMLLSILIFLIVFQKIKYGSDNMGDVVKHEVEFDLTNDHGQKYAGIVKSAKYLNTANMKLVWELVQEKHREQREAKQEGSQ